MQPILNKTVSVIVPCFSYAHYLPECIDSISKQTYQPHEVIIVNDGSPDNTSDVAKELMVKYPKLNLILIEKENGGLSSARNAGIKLATGDLIQCIDADDKMTPGAIEEHVKLITDDKTIAQCALMEFDERYAVMVPTVPRDGLRLKRTMQANTIFCNAMFPRQAWVDVGGYDESETMRLGYEDWEFWIRCLAYGYKVETSDFIALRYRAHYGQMTQATSHPNAQKLYKFIYNKHRDLYEKHNTFIAGMELN
jgi:glycosyltransferase involved in cell wall biosynthesis